MNVIRPIAVYIDLECVDATDDALEAAVDELQRIIEDWNAATVIGYTPDVTPEDHGKMADDAGYDG